MGWLAIIAVVLGCSSSAGKPTPAAIDAALARAGAFLAIQQDTDGAIRSHRYAALKEGWSLTPLATLALRFTPERAAYQRGVAFVATMTPETPGINYPIYAFSIGALVLGAPEHVDAHRAQRDALLTALRGLQRQDGGWGYDPSASNLSATVFAVGALALAGVPPTDPALVKAHAFVRRCQNPDGGFFFSPDNADANKAGPGKDGKGFRSYGSMTADGIRVLLRTGSALGDPAVAAGVQWLDERFDPKRNPGDFVRINEIRRASSYYYWTWTAAHALTHTPHDRRWAEQLAAELLRLQGSDGSWQNSATEMREDDPVIATSFAIAALALCRAALSGERQTHASWK